MRTPRLIEKYSRKLSSWQVQKSASKWKCDSRNDSRWIHESLFKVLICDVPEYCNCERIVVLSLSVWRNNHYLCNIKVVKQINKYINKSEYCIVPNSLGICKWVSRTLKICAILLEVVSKVIEILRDTVLRNL